METVTTGAEIALGYVVHAAAALGRPVLYTAESHDQARAVFQHLADKGVGALSNQIKAVYRSHGQERVVFRSGGQVSFISRRDRAAGRGFSASVLVVDGEKFTDSERMASLLPCIAAADHPVLVCIDRTSEQTA